MVERTIYLFAKGDVSVTRVGGGTPSNDVLGQSLWGNAFSWQVPHDLMLTFPTDTVALTFEDADGILSDDPFSGATVIDQFLTQEVTIDGVTYTPSAETTRWQTPPPVNVENEYEVTLFDDLGNVYRMVGVSITQGYTSTVVGVTFEGDAPPPGTPLFYIQGVSTYGNGQTSPIPEAVPCFLEGTLIETPRGPRRIEELTKGDLVLTLDKGPQPVRWIGKSMVPGFGARAPIRISKGTLGNRRDLYVSPNHRILLRSWAAELLFATHEVLVPAKFMVDGTSVQIRPRLRACYLHLLLDAHEIVFSDGISSESLYAGILDTDVLGLAAQAEVRAVIAGSDAPTQQLCRRSLRRDEAGLLLRALRAYPSVQGLQSAGVDLARAALSDLARCA